MTEAEPRPDDSPSGASVAAFAESVLDEVGRAVVGKREALSLVLAGILAKGHVLLEDFPGLGKTLAARSFARRARPGLRPRAVHAGPAARRPHRVLRLRPAACGVRLPARPDLRRAAAGRRDQPHPAQDPGGAARGDAGGPGHGRGPDPPAAQPLPRPRHRQPGRVRGHLPAARRRSSTGSCSASPSATPARRRSTTCCAGASTGSARRSTSSRSPTPPAWRAVQAAVETGVGRRVAWPATASTSSPRPAPTPTCSPAPRPAAASGWC